MSETVYEKRTNINKFRDERIEKRSAIRKLNGHSSHIIKIVLHDWSFHVSWILFLLRKVTFTLASPQPTHLMGIKQ